MAIPQCDRRPSQPSLAGLDELPLADEAFVATWRLWASDARQLGAWPVLRRELPQLRFPIARGMRESAAYRRATLSGIFPPGEQQGIELERPHDLTVRVHASLAGGIGVIATSHRADFDTLVRALTLHNEPTMVPRSMGACLVGGQVNWQQLRRLRREWEAGAVGDVSENAWRKAFRVIAPGKERYQHRYILVSNGPYSGVDAARLFLGDEHWRLLSDTIRLEHECTHYFARRVFGESTNALLDELVADYGGLAAATAHFSADWFREFMVDRLCNYRVGLSDDAWNESREIVHAAAGNVELFDATLPALRDIRTRGTAIVALYSLTLEELAAADGAVRLAAAYEARTR